MLIVVAPFHTLTQIIFPNAAASDCCERQPPSRTRVTYMTFSMANGRQWALMDAPLSEIKRRFASIIGSRRYANISLNTF